MTYSAQMEAVVGSEGQLFRAYSQLSAPTLPELFDRALAQINTDFGSIAPCSITLIVSETPANGPA